MGHCQIHIMDLSKLKNRPSYPFETIGVAVAFSPRLEAMLQEAKHYSDAFKSQIVLMHVGEKDPRKEEMLDVLITNIGFPKTRTRVIWMEGDPTDTILSLCKLNVVDLLILGALEKENLYKYYVGSVARNISRRAKCSVLLITHPQLQVKRFKKIVINGVDNPKTLHTLRTAAYFARCEKLKDLTLVQEIDMPTFAMTMADTNNSEANKIKREMLEEESAKLMQMVEQVKSEEMEIVVKTVSGKPGYAIANFARTKGYDLLVLNSPDTHLGLFDRIFTHDIEYILADLPCNLLIVHSRV